MRGVALSTLWSGIFFYFEVALLIIGSIFMIVSHPGALTLAPFKFSNLSGGLAGLGIAIGAVYRPESVTVPEIEFPFATPFTSQITAMSPGPVTVA